MAPGRFAPYCRTQAGPQRNSFNFKVPKDAREFTLVLGVSQSLFVDFLAKPEQVHEDGKPQ
jgi:hypothetical protein